MRNLLLRVTRVFVVSMLLLLMPAVILAQGQELKPGSPPVGQPLVSEGSLAVSLGNALAVITTDDEIEAESRLGELGIAPRNGWIADYPVTPDIVVELQESVAAAADAERLSMSKAEALKILNDVVAGFGLTVRQHTSGTPYEPTPASCANYPNPAMVRDSYASEGTPVVTYYCPPPAYYDLYAWVPGPFWWSDLWFPGFFILHDFHRVVHVHKKVVVITNHFNDPRSNRAFRIDPVQRFRGRTFAGIGVTRPGEVIRTGVPRSERTIFNAPRGKRTPDAVGSPSQRDRERISPPGRGGERSSPAPRGSGEGGGRGRSGGGGSFERGGRR